MDPELRDRWLERAERRLSSGGMRAGAVRTAVVELLARDGQCLVSAQEITEWLKAAGVGSPASVYRVLDQLFALGLLHRVEGRDGIARYEIADPHHHHHHIVDSRTGTVDAFTDEALEAAIADVARRLGFRLDGHDVILRGIKER
ncbi:Fur family transcriptional regulator [Conexibacter sp. CPCC 206217]|uniref:Fur family transcriptional regulator n=1 Tax=Conexibacter sp. CPCC 206217 TaxID=3064574 RepID=UPI002727D781|nr:Fur family transcriptional regulator [Conexibacter sp. CPCC 206217]MDO8213118.1 Fur family transcriptional regulator [Conexibacter sp. CPCC 206217]